MAEAHRGDLIQARATPWAWSFYILGPTARSTERSFGVRAARCRFFASQLAGGRANCPKGWVAGQFDIEAALRRHWRGKRAATASNCPTTRGWNSRERTRGKEFPQASLREGKRQQAARTPKLRSAENDGAASGCRGLARRRFSISASMLWLVWGKRRLPPARSLRPPRVFFSKHFARNVGPNGVRPASTSERSADLEVSTCRPQGRRYNFLAAPLRYQSPISW